MSPRALHVLLPAALALFAVPMPVAGQAADDPPAPLVWFEGDAAVYDAGRHINDALAYENEYNAGRLAVQWVPQYEDGLFIRLRMAPHDGHQVVYEKGKTKPSVEFEATRCAEFMLRIEDFEAETLQTYMDNKQRGPLLVDSGDEADGRICIRDDGAVGIVLREVIADRNLYERNAHSFLKDGRGYVSGL